MTTSDPASQERSHSLDWVIGGGLTLATLGLYVSTLAPTVLEADGGEFQFVPWLPGIAHPTGYPLYTLLGWLWAHAFPFGEVAWRMNLLSAIFAAVTVGVTYGTARQLFDAALPDPPRSARIIAAIAAAVVFAVTPTFWSQAIIAEVYTLHALFVSVMMWLALKWQKVDCDLNSRIGKLLALTFGLSLTHHRTTILLLPAVLMFWWWHTRSSDWRRPFTRFNSRLTLTYALLLGGPLLIYLYLPLIAPSTPYATLTLSDTQKLILYDNSLAGFWKHVTGSVFTGELRPATAGLDRLFLTWQLLLEQVGWVGAGLSVAGVMVLWRNRNVDLLLLTALSFLAFVAFNLVYFIGDIFVLFIPPWLVVCLWIGVGLPGLADLAAKLFIKRKRTLDPFPVFQALHRRLEEGIYPLAFFGVFLIILLFLIVIITMRNTGVYQQNDLTTRERWQEILAEPIPQTAVLLSNDRNEIMPMWYYQYVEQRRPDLLGLFPLIVSDPAFANIGLVLDQALASHRPVYLIKPMDGLSLKANLTPEGTLFRATAIELQPAHRYNATLPEVVIQSGADKSLTETIKLIGYDVIPTDLSPGDELTVTLYWQPVQPLSVEYTSFVHLVNSAGQGVTQSDHKPGGDFYSSSTWQVNEILRDQHTLIIPPDAPTGQYHLRAGMYYRPQPGKIMGMGSGAEIGVLVITK